MYDKCAPVQFTRQHPKGVMEMPEYDSGPDFGGEGNSRGSKSVFTRFEPEPEAELVQQNPQKRSRISRVAIILISLIILAVASVLFRMDGDSKPSPQPTNEMGVVEGLSYEQMLTRTCVELDQLEVNVQIDAKNAVLFGIGTGTALAESAPNGHTPAQIAADLTNACAE